MADALFLDQHPGWSWSDLQAAPYRVVEGLRIIDGARAKRARSDG